MKLSNAKEEKITTVIGVIFLLIAAFLLVVDVYKTSYVVDWKVLLGTILAGVGLIFSPDDLYGFLKRKVDNTNF